MSNLQTLEFKIKGTTPLCMHSPQASDALCDHPLYQPMRELAKKRTKSEEDHRELARLEWMLSLYVNTEGKLFTPGRCWEAALKDTAKRQKLGKKFNAAVMCDDAILQFPDADKSPDELWNMKKYCMRIGMRVSNARVMRSVPVFANWSVDLKVSFLESELDEKTIAGVVRDCGIINGFLEFRPRHGRFVIE